MFALQLDGVRHYLVSCSLLQKSLAKNILDIIASSSQCHASSISAHWVCIACGPIKQMLRARRACFPGKTVLLRCRHTVAKQDRLRTLYSPVPITSINCDGGNLFSYYHDRKSALQPCDRAQECTVQHQRDHGAASEWLEPQGR